MRTPIKPGPYRYDLTIDVPIELEPPTGWTPGSTEHRTTIQRHCGGEITASDPATKEGVRAWLVNWHCADLTGHQVAVTHFALTPIQAD